jgi:YopJ family protease
MGLCMSKQSTLTTHGTISHAQTGNSPRASPSGEAAPDTSRFSHLPPRAERKAQALAEALRFANIDPQLAHYAQRVLDTVANSQPTREISNLDAKTWRS